MKSTLLTLILVFLTGICYKVFPQDKIVTVNQDTIECKITRISNSYIFFEVTTKGVVSSGRLPLARVSDYTISAAGQSNGKKTASPVSFERIRVGISGGPGYLIASSKKAEEAMVGMGLTSGQAKSYYKDLKTGIIANSDITFLFTPEYGAGLRYKFLDTYGNLEGFFDPQDGVNLIYTTYSEHIYVNYFGASYFSQKKTGRQNAFSLSSEISFGLAVYRNEAEYVNSCLLLTGKNIGMDASFGLEYFITKNFSAGADLSVFYSSLRKIRITDGTSTTTIKLDKDNYENLSRIELSAGIRYYFLKR